MAGEPTIHRFPAEHEGAFVNAYLVETEAGVVAVDGLLTVSAAKEMRIALAFAGLSFKPSDGLEPSTPTYHSAPRREARVRAGSSS